MPEWKSMIDDYLHEENKARGIRVEKLLAIYDLVQAAHRRSPLQKNRLYPMGKAKAGYFWADGLLWGKAVHNLQQILEPVSATQ